ncbi:MAG: GNAT family N-acetyltransferase [Candidatus Izimaplasma sp.]|nr:GNAT family N-acetyltransferase [Candidatus Izimaplasma bacterium]
MKRYHFAVCTKEDVPEINRIMDEIDHEVNTDEIFVKDDHTFIENHISKQGFIVKVSKKHKIIAFLIVRFPKSAKDNLGKDANLNKEALNNVAHIESLAVVPKHRGKRLGRKMIKYADKIIKQKGIKHSMATVSPRNKYSLITFLKRDYEVIKISNKYSGVKRLILRKKI